MPTNDSMSLGVLIVDAIAIVIGTALLGILIVAFVRANGRRLPCLLIAFSGLLYILSHILEMLDVLKSISYHWEVAQTVFSLYTDIFAFSATFAVLWNRRTALAAAGKAVQPVVKRTVDAVFLCLMALSVILGATVDPLTNFPTFIFAYYILWALMFLNLAISTLLTHRRVSQIRENDTPITTMTFALLPLWMLHIILRLLFLLYINAPIAVAVELELLPALIMSVITMLGLLSRAWTPLGNVSDGAAVVQSNTSAPQWERRDGYYIPVDFMVPQVTNGRTVAEV